MAGASWGTRREHGFTAHFRGWRTERQCEGPQAAAERLCGCVGLEWDVVLSRPLPLSRHTLTPPAPDKWHKNAAGIAPFLQATGDVARRAGEMLGQGAEASAV